MQGRMNHHVLFILIILWFLLTCNEYIHHATKIDENSSSFYDRQGTSINIR